MKHQNEIRPRWVMSIRDLPKTRKRQKYRVEGTKEIIIAKRWREVLERLMEGPIYCASPVRLSDAVCVLRREHGVKIETLSTHEGRKYYQLTSHVSEVSQ